MENLKVSPFILINNKNINDKILSGIGRSYIKLSELFTLMFFLIINIFYFYIFLINFWQ